MKSSPSFVIRRGLDADADAMELAAVHIEAWKWAYQGLMPSEYLQRLDDEFEARLDMWRRLLSADPQRHAVWVATEGHTMVGFAATGPSRGSVQGGSEARLYSIYLLERVAGTGVGRALMGTALTELRRQGYEACMLWVLETNRRARRFYERAGWTLDEGRQVENQRGFDLVEVRYRIQL